MTNSSESQQRGANGPEQGIASSPWHIRTIRAPPWLYYSVSQSRLCYSRYFLAAADRYRFRKQRTQFAMSPVESTNWHNLKSCRPRLTRDLDQDGHDGRISDEELAKYYPPESWATIRARAGSAVIVHGNGFHKGPVWPAAGSPSNLPRTALRIDIRGDEGQR